MKIVDDGIIKYDRSNFAQSGPIELKEYEDLEYWRKKLYLLNLIGEYSDSHIGFGNLSIAKDYSHLNSQISNSSIMNFLITGTQTGKFPELNGEHYTRVLSYDILKLKIYVYGPIEASSEALTHAAIYSQNNEIQTIFHLHSKAIWEGLIKDNQKSTPKEIPYGTAEMAIATQKCVENSNFGFFSMQGHEDGIIIYGKSLNEVGELCLKLFNQYSS